MLTHYPRWLTIPSFSMIIAACVGALSEGNWQIAANSLATAILLGIVLQSNAYLRDDLDSLLEREADKIVEARRSSGRIPVGPVVIPPGGGSRDHIETP